MKWENLPSTATPINAENLNKITPAIQNQEPEENIVWLKNGEMKKILTKENDGYSKYTDTISIGSNNNENGLWCSTSNNLLNLNSFKSATVSGITTSINDNVMNFNGTSTGGATWLPTIQIGILKPGTYTYTMTKKSGSANFAGNQARLYLVNNTDNENLVSIHLGDFSTSTTKTFTINKTIQISMYGYMNGANISANNLKFELQLNKGTSTLNFEPYRELGLKFNDNGIYKTITNENNYSNGEIIIGEWFGKPLYSRTISFQTALNAGVQNVPHNISNVSEIYIDNSKSFMFDTGTGASYSFPITQYNSGTSHDELSVACTRTNIVFMVQTSWGAGWKKYITLNYTKTTD